MADPFDPYYTWLGIPPDEQPANYYRLLGIKLYETNQDAIANAADQRMAYLRTFQTGQRSEDSQRLLNEVAAARVCLLKADKRAAYDQQLRNELTTIDEPPPLDALLDIPELDLLPDIPDLEPLPDIPEL